VTWPELGVDQRLGLERMLGAWLERHPPALDTSDHGLGMQLVGAEMLRREPPALVSCMADMAGRPAHAVVGLRSSGEEVQPLQAGRDPVLGELDLDGHSVVVVDAFGDTELAVRALEAVMGTGHDPAARPQPDEGAPGDLVVCFDMRYVLTAFPWPFSGEHPGVALTVALDRAGFNHLAAPLAVWRRQGRDLGIVQEFLVGRADGWALALASLRDLYASGGSPEDAGGDFAPEADALGMMTARMHMALAEGFGQQPVEVPVERGPEGAAELVTITGIRSHGDFHLGRTARTDLGWVVQDTMPGGCSPGTDTVLMRSPLADVADMVWSFGHVATEAAQERDPADRDRAAGLGAAWERRSSSAFVQGYLSTAGLGDLVPDERQLVDDLVTSFRRRRLTTDA
jgi:predicted trehalose synthase